MLIGDLAETVGLDTQTIRFYERRGLLPEPRRAANGYRTYDETSVERLRFIRSAQTAGLTLAEIGSVVDLRDHGDAPCTHVSALLSNKLDAVRARRAELATLESELERLIERGDLLNPADCTESDICHILTTPHQAGGRPLRDHESAVGGPLLLPLDELGERLNADLAEPTNRQGLDLPARDELIQERSPDAETVRGLGHRQENPIVCSDRHVDHLLVTELSGAEAPLRHRYDKSKLGR